MGTVDCEGHGEAGSPVRKPPQWPRKAEDDGAWDRLRVTQVRKSGQMRIYFEAQEPSLFADGLSGGPRQTLGVFPGGKTTVNGIYGINPFFFFCIFILILVS